MSQTPYPATFDVVYPHRELDRVSTALRGFTIIPIALVLGAIGGGHASFGGPALLVLPPLLMLVGRGKYPRWWFDFNVQIMRFAARVGAYAALLTDVYPSTDDEQDVRLELPEPEGLDRWLPLVKWFLAIPHYVVLAFLYIGAVGAVVLAWFAILLTGRYPRGLFEFVVGVARWHVRVTAYAFALVTDEYPPFRLGA